MTREPLAFLITFSCTGARLHGSAAGSVDRGHNAYGTPHLAPTPRRERLDRARMRAPPYQLGDRHRVIVLLAIAEVCAYRGWTLLAAHVRTNHVHAVVAATASAERMMTDFKAYATRALVAARVDDGEPVRWARHGSTRWIWTPEEVQAAVDYVVREQGEPIAASSGAAARCGVVFELGVGASDAQAAP